VFDKVTITYRGTKYEIGRGKDFYGIWLADAPRSQPLERWPETAEGWSAAWTRFAGIEVPGTIVPVGRRTPPVAQGAAPAAEAMAPAGPATAADGTVPADPAVAAAPGAPAGTAQPAGAPQPAAASSPEEQPTGPLGAPAVTTGGYTSPFGDNTGSYGQYSGGAGRYGQPTGPHGSDAGRNRPGLTRLAPVLAGRAGSAVAAGLLVAGVILGIAGLFPSYLGTSLTSQASQLIPHLMYLAAWTLGAALILLGGSRARPGALLAAGVSVVTFGLFVSDAGLAIDGGSTAGAGLVLSFVGWLACAAGSALAIVRRTEPGLAPGTVRPVARPRGAALGPAVLVALAGLGVAAAFAPAWDSYTLRAASGQQESLTAGNAFANPGWVIAGNVIVMAAVAAVVLVAVMWRPVRHGAALLAGAAVVMAAQAISALVQAGSPASPAQFGISSAQASQIGLAITSGVTPAFWIYFGFLVALVVSCAWMLFTPHDVPGRPVAAGGYAWPGVPADGLGGEYRNRAEDRTVEEAADEPEFVTAPSTLPTAGPRTGEDIG
jgi:hypothetical protein